MDKLHNRIWWRNPNERNFGKEERKISWLELFYDLVYVIAISKATHHLGTHLTFSGFLDYFYMVALIYWGWLNGSWHHDILGANDVRTIFLTIWQMTVLSALIVTLNSPPDKVIINATIAILVMQLYIAYLWWSEGIYDKNNINIRLYYVGFYLLAFVLLLSIFFIDKTYWRYVFYTTLIINYIPPYIVSRILEKNLQHEHRLSASMTERLGLFTIILFGEVILGLINGISEYKNLSIYTWELFVLAIYIVFSLWFIFFKLIGDKHVKKGYLRSNWYAFLFLPIASSLGIIGVMFDKLFIETMINDTPLIRQFLSIFISIFLLIVFLLTFLTQQHELYIKVLPKIRRLLLFVIVGIVIFSVFSQYLSLFMFLSILLAFLLIMPITLLIFWNNIELKNVK